MVGGSATIPSRLLAACATICNHLLNIWCHIFSRWLHIWLHTLRAPARLIATWLQMRRPLCEIGVLSLLCTLRAHARSSLIQLSSPPKRRRNEHVIATWLQMRRPICEMGVLPLLSSCIEEQTGHPISESRRRRRHS